MNSRRMMVGLFVLTLTVTNLQAQDKEKKEETGTKTWFSGKNSKSKLNYIGLYVAPEIQYAGLAGGFTPMSGVSAMLQFNKKWGVGLSANSTLDNYTPTKLSAAKAYNFNAGFGGLKIEYTPKPDAVFHVSFPLVIGAGMARIDSVGATDHGRYDGKGRNGKGEYHFGNDSRSDNMFFIIQPGIRLETNVMRVAKLFIGANYRIAAGKSTETSTNPILIPKSSQLSGLSINAGIKVGIFDFDVHKKRKTPKLFKQH